MKDRSIRLAGACVVSIISAIVSMVHKKFGGHLAGGRYSTSHDWDEMLTFIPEVVFIAVFMFLVVYFGFFRRL